MPRFRYLTKARFYRRVAALRARVPAGVRIRAEWAASPDVGCSWDRYGRIYVNSNNGWILIHTATGGEMMAYSGMRVDRLLDLARFSYESGRPPSKLAKRVAWWRSRKYVESVAVDGDRFYVTLRDGYVTDGGCRLCIHKDDDQSAAARSIRRA